MPGNHLLSIVIPTRNRWAYLDRCLELLSPLLGEEAIQVVIQDNASTDETEAMVSKWRSVHPSICYARNSENIGPDRNFERALKAARSQYIWLLGDSYTVPREAIRNVLELIRSSKLNPFDAILVNANGRIEGIQSRTYTSSQELFKDLGWHTTLLSTLIFSSELVASAEYQRYGDTNFLHTGILFESLAKKSSIRVAWIADILIENIVLEGQTKTSWQLEAFEIWLRRWPSFVLSLPPIYALKIKLKVIRSHNTDNNVFGFQLLYTLKRDSFPTIRTLFCRTFLERFASPNTLLLKACFVALVPEWMFCTIRRLRDQLRRQDVRFVSQRGPGNGH